MKSLRKRAIAKAHKRLMCKKNPLYIPPFDLRNAFIKMREEF